MCRLRFVALTDYAINAVPVGDFFPKQTKALRTLHADAPISTTIKGGHIQFEAESKIASASNLLGVLFLFFHRCIIE